MSSCHNNKSSAKGNKIHQTARSAATLFRQLDLVKSENRYDCIGYVYRLVEVLSAVSYRKRLPSFYCINLFPSQPDRVAGGGTEVEHPVIIILCDSNTHGISGLSLIYKQR